MTDIPIPDSGKFVSAFARGLRVIEAFGVGRPRMTLAEISAETGLDRAVARRLLLTLVELGMARTDGKQFELTPGILRLGFSCLASLGLDERLRPDLDALSVAVGEATSIGVLDGLEVVLVARSEAAALPFIYAPRIGSRLPALTSSSGRILLASHPAAEIESLTKRPEGRDRIRQAIAEARRTGYAMNVEETSEGLLSLSVPVRSRAGHALAALNVSSHAARTTPEAMVQKFLPHMKEVAERVSQLMI